MTDIRNSIGAHYTDRAMGMLESMLGIRQDYNIPTDGTILRAAWTDGEDLTCRKWVECYTNLTDGEALATVTAGHSALEGEVVIGRYRYGKGEVILCGTMLDENGMARLVETALADAGVSHVKTSGSLTVVPRDGDGMEGLIVCETGCTDASIELPYPATDVLTGKTYAGTMAVEPYAVYVLVKS